MKISVVICTHNRADSLRRALASLEKQTLPRDQFEVLVVDNASTDYTKAVAQSFSHLSLTYLYESQLGLSRARNTGWQKAQANYIAFIDDDAVASPQWLAALLDTFTLHTDKEMAVGGRVELASTVTIPDWVDDSLRVSLGSLNLSASTTDLQHSPYYLHGCNMAFSRALLMKYDGFYSSLGRRGSKLLSGEEILLQQQLKSDGYPIFYTDQAAVTHHVDISRLSRNWFVKRMYWEGVTTRRIECITKTNQSTTSEIVGLLRQVCSFGFIFRARFADVCRAMWRVGRIVESFRN